MNPIDLPCNPCAIGRCTDCVADRLERKGYISKASNHCNCSAESHPYLKKYEKVQEENR